MKMRFFISIIFVFLFSLGSVFASVGGASVTSGSDSSAPADSAGNHSALAGNVTELTITGISNTQSWQGYYGNVSGTIQLADSGSNVLYNWSLANPQGELYASTDNAVTWSSIACFNYSADGTSQETAYNITEGDADGINETFSLTDHDAFYTGSVSFNADTCPSTRIFDNTHQGVDQHFEEVLLWDGDAIVFTSLLEDDLSGFDGKTHDFEVMVLEDGHNGDTGTTPYYFYVELE